MQHLTKSVNLDIFPLYLYNILFYLYNTKPVDLSLLTNSLVKKSHKNTNGYRKKGQIENVLIMVFNGSGRINFVIFAIWY